MRGLADAALRSHPALAHRHDIEIRALAPELRDAVPLSREVLAESVPPSQRTRIHPWLRTRRIAHGLTDFLHGHLIELDCGPRSLVIENLQHADQSDRELVATFVRRIDPSLLTIVACTEEPPAGGSPPGGTLSRSPAGVPAEVSPGGSADVARADPSRDAAEGAPPLPGRLPESAEPLADALARNAARIRVPEQAAGTHSGGRVPGDGGHVAALAARFINGDGVSDDPVLLDAYTRLSGPQRARLHDARADELGRAGFPSAWLGAIPYHRERGTDPEGAGVRALREAAEHCYRAGFHHGVVDLALRGRAKADPGRDPRNWWLFTSLAASSLAALRRGVESEALYDEARSLSTDPAVHRTAAYETAMLYARHHSRDRLDPQRARRWVNEAIAFASLLPDPAERAFHLAFNSNGRALVEMRLGNIRGALKIVDDSISMAERELPPGSHPLDRCSLLANRARLLAAADRLEEALACNDMLLALDPTYGEYHFERGNLLHQLGRDDQALAAYARAENLSLPFPELHYNRAEILIARGEDDAALAQLGRVLALDPDFLDARINRAGLLAGRGDTEAAWSDVAEGLAIDPGNPYLLCLVGQLEAAGGRAGAALEAFSSAIAAAPGLAAAWAGRAEVRLESGDPGGAVADLSRALEGGEDPALLFNRAVAHQAAGDLGAAIGDARRAHELRPGDEDTRRLLRDLEAER